MNYDKTISLLKDGFVIDHSLINGIVILFDQQSNEFHVVDFQDLITLCDLEVVKFLGTFNGTHPIFLGKFCRYIFSGKEKSK